MKEITKIQFIFGGAVSSIDDLSPIFVHMMLLVEKEVSSADPLDIEALRIAAKKGFPELEEMVFAVAERTPDMIKNPEEQLDFMKSYLNGLIPD